MKLAVNYSIPTADLVREGRVVIDRFKCPPWPDMIALAQTIHPTYVHFSLKVGTGVGDAIDTETNRPADWRQVERLLVQTETPLVNLHLSPRQTDHPDIPCDSDNPDHVEMIAEWLIRDVSAVAARFGPERVIVESDYPGPFLTLRPAILPEVVGLVIEETGCGLLLDLSHARLAARALRMDARSYISALPVERTREIHVTGLGFLEGKWLDRMRVANVEDHVIQHLTGQLIDHLPMTDDDWAFFAWSVEQLRRGAWGSPWIVAFEYGGVGPLWEALTEREALVEQLPRLRTMIQRALPPERAPA